MVAQEGNHGRDMYKVTVLIASCNYGCYVGRAIQSTLNQTFSRHDYEILVVDDGSTDDTGDRLRQFEGQIRLYQQQNLGLARACNAGIKLSQGRYLIRLDADDELEPEALFEMTSVLDRNCDVELVCADRWEIGSDGHESLVEVDLGNIFSLIAPGVMFRTRCLHDVGMYRPLFWEEHDLMIRLYERYKPACIKKPLYRYYQHSGSMTQDPERRRQGWMELVEIWGVDELRKWGYSEDLEATWSQIARRDKVTLK